MKPINIAAPTAVCHNYAFFSVRKVLILTLLSLVLGMPGKLLACNSTPNWQIALAGASSSLSAEISLKYNLSTQVELCFQLEILSQAGFEACSGEFQMSGDRQYLSFVAEQPAGAFFT